MKQAQPQGAETSDPRAIPAQTGGAFEALWFWAALLMAAVGACFTAAGAALLTGSLRLHHGAKTTATDVAVRPLRAEGDLGYQPVLRFRTPDGRAQTFASPLLLSDPPGVGTAMPVVYDPAAPQQARIASAWLRVGIPLCYTGVGLLLLAGGLVRIGRSLRRHRRARPSAQETVPQASVARPAPQDAPTRQAGAPTPCGMPRKAGYCLLQVRGNCLYVWQGWTARWLTLALTALLVGGTVAGFRADALGRSLVLALLAAALVGGLLAGHRPWVFDRAQRTVRRGRRCIARFEQVATVGVREQQTGEEGTTYATVLVLTSGQRMALNTIRTGQAAPFGELAYWIAQFTGLRGPIRNPRGPGA